MSSTLAHHRLLAEKGIGLALAGQHHAALACYREAMREAAGSGANLIVLRHYSECLLESLELLGAYEQVVLCCDAALEHYAGHPPATPLAWQDLAHIRLRRGAVNAKRGRAQDALEDCNAALDAARQAGTALPLAEDLRHWLGGGLTVAAARITAQQRQRDYFRVRAANPRPHLAPPANASPA